MLIVSYGTALRLNNRWAMTSDSFHTVMVIQQYQRRCCSGGGHCINIEPVYLPRKEREEKVTISYRDMINSTAGGLSSAKHYRPAR